ncbi:MAG: hypothetical protein ACI9S8_001996 [Chlamydiales bacterium]
MPIYTNCSIPHLPTGDLDPCDNSKDSEIYDDSEPFELSDSSADFELCDAPSEEDFSTLHLLSNVFSSLLSEEQRDALRLALSETVNS